MTNLSQWFYMAEQNPWEVGVYEALFPQDKEFQWFSYWDGEKFNSGWTTKERALQHAGGVFVDSTQPTKWRGLSTNPEVKKKPQNKRKTMYVVIDRGGVVDTPVAAFFDAKNAQEYSERLAYPRIKRIRFRTPE